MSGENGIIILDDVSLMRRRMSGLLQGFHVRVYEATNEIELFNILAEEKINISLILMELGFDVAKGIEILSKIKEKKPLIPVFIITSNNKRQTFIRLLAEGASDYILKPFEDEFLLDKILSVLKIRREIVTENMNISFNLRSYLNAELKKAKKGNYDITILMCTLFDSYSDENNIVENKYIKVVEDFYNSIRNHLWDTDIFERYGSQTFIGVFPYCTAANVDIIEKKTTDYFYSIVKDNKELSSLQMAIATVTYPNEDLEAKETLLTLGTRVTKVIENIKAEIVIARHKKDK